MHAQQGHAKCAVVGICARTMKGGMYHQTLILPPCPHLPALPSCRRAGLLVTASKDENGDYVSIAPVPWRHAPRARPACNGDARARPFVWLPASMVDADQHAWGVVTVGCLGFAHGATPTRQRDTRAPAPAVAAAAAAPALSRHVPPGLSVPTPCASHLLLRMQPYNTVTVIMLTEATKLFITAVAHVREYDRFTTPCLCVPDPCTTPTPPPHPLLRNEHAHPAYFAHRTERHI